MMRSKTSIRKRAHTEPPLLGLSKVQPVRRNQIVLTIDAGRKTEAGPPKKRARENWEDDWQTDEEGSDDYDAISQESNADYDAEWATRNESDRPTSELFKLTRMAHSLQPHQGEPFLSLYPNRTLVRM